MKFAEYEQRAVSTAIYPGQGTALGLMYVALKMNGEAGEFAEHVGKALRDDSLAAEEQVSALTGSKTTDKCAMLGELTTDRRELLIKEIGDIGWYLAAACRELGIPMEEAFQRNLDKLRSRKDRGVLGGSGDNR